MFVYRCKHCEKQEPNDETHNNENYTTVTDDSGFNPNAVCAHCGRGGMVCDHPSGSFDKVKQGFICSWCHEGYGPAGFAALRQLARTSAYPELSNLIDVTDH